jgi:hypothetical protein
MNELNLLPNVAKFQASKMKTKALVNKVSIYLGIGWVVILLGIFGVWAVMLSRISIEQRRFDRAKEEFESLQQEIVLTQQLKYKAKIVSEVLDERFEYHEIFKVIQNMFSEKIKIDKTEIKEGSYVSISGSTDGIKSVDEIQDKVTQINNKEIKGLFEAKLGDLSLAENTWRFSMEVGLE